MSMNLDNSVSKNAEVFKFIMDEFIINIPKWKKEYLYMKYCNNIKNRNSEKRLRNSHKKNRRKEYIQKPLLQKEYIKFHVLSLLLDTRYALFIDNCTLNEISYILEISIERVRQVECQTLLKIKNPLMLKQLNKEDRIQSIMEYKEELINERLKSKIE